MITTDKDMKMEDQVLMLYYSQAVCVPSSFSIIPCLYLFIHIHL